MPAASCLPTGGSLLTFTGAQIKALAEIPNDYELWEVKGDETVPVGNEQEVHIHEGQHFRAIPAGTFGVYGSTP